MDMLVCSECGARFFKSEKLFNHIETEHPDNIEHILNKSITPWAKKYCFDPQKIIDHLKGDAKDAD